MNDDNHIRIFFTTDGEWQAIGYYRGRHVAAFGSSPQDALEKAVAVIPVTEQYQEDDGSDLV